jgi:hypothetical protein
LTSHQSLIASSLRWGAIQRSIKGAEYFSSAGPSDGVYAKDTLAVRGTINLYHYRPMAEEVYRTPVLIVMATTNRGYILDLVPGQRLIEFLLKRGYDVYMLDWTPPMEDYVLDFIPDCIRPVQEDSGETDISVIGYCFGGFLSSLVGATDEGTHPDVSRDALLPVRPRQIRHSSRALFHGAHGRDVLAIPDDLKIDKAHVCDCQWAAGSGKMEGPAQVCVPVAVDQHSSGASEARLAAAHIKHA